MSWEEAEINLRENIVIHTHLDKKHKYKVVISVPPSPCNRLKQEGFRIQVGEKSVIPVPFEMLKELFYASRSNQGIYNHRVFLEIFPKELSTKPCYVHSVGKLFEVAGIAEKLNMRDYQII